MFHHLIFHPSGQMDRHFILDTRFQTPAGFLTIPALVAVLLALRVPVFAANVDLQPLFAGNPSEVTLNPANNYIGGVTITNDCTIIGNGATIDLDALPSRPQTIIVRNGANVSFQGVTIKDAPFACIEAKEASTITLDVVSLSAPGRGILLKEGSTGSLSTVAIQSGFIGIDVQTGSNLSMMGDSTVAAATTGINIENSSASIHATQITGTPAKGIGGKNANVLLDTVSILQPTEAGILLTGPGTFTATNLLFVQLNTRALYLDQYSVDLFDVRVTTLADPLATPANPIVGVRAITLDKCTSVSIDEYVAKGVEFGLEIVAPTGPVTLANMEYTRCAEGIRITDAAQPASMSAIDFDGLTRSLVTTENSDATLTSIHAVDSRGILVRALDGSSMVVADSLFLNSAYQPGETVLQATDSSLTVAAGSVVIRNDATGTGQGNGVQGVRSIVNVQAGTEIIGYSLGVHLTQNSTGTVSGTFFDRNGEAVFADNSDVTFEDSRIEHSTVGQPLSAIGTCDVIYRRNEAYVSIESGVGLNNAGTTLVEDNYFEDLGFGGISITPDALSPTAIVRRNTVRRAGNPAGLNNLANGAVYTLNAILDCEQFGIQDRGTGATFARNFLLGTQDKVAALSGTGPSTFADNLMVKSRDGIFIDKGPYTLIGNDFRMTGDGVNPVFAVFVASGGRITSASFNSLVSLANNGLWVTDGPIPPAANNWWGSPTGPNEDGYLGPGSGSQVHRAAFTPWLSAPPMQSHWIDDLSIQPNIPLLTDFGNPQAGIEIEFHSERPITGAASGLWLSDQKPADTPAPSPPPATVPVYITTINDARIAIHAGSATLRLGPAVHFNKGLLPSGASVFFHDDAGVWTPVASTLVGDSLRVRLPAHSTTLMVAFPHSPSWRYVQHLLAHPVSRPPDANIDGVIDAADLLEVISD